MRFLLFVLFFGILYSDEVKEEDFLKSAQEMNSNLYSSPPTQFRKGHVTPKKINPKDLLKETKMGYEIQLPGKTQIPTPTICGDILFSGGGFHSREFYAFEASTGKKLWAVDIDDDGPSTAACADGIVIFNTESCTIFALDAKTGKQLWSLWLGDPLMSTPTVSDGKVFTSYPASGQFQPSKKNQKANLYASHVLVALNLKTGKILWQKWIDSDVMSSPVAENKDLYVSTFSGTVYKFNKENGEILSAVKTRATSAPVITGESVFFTKRAEEKASMKAEESIVSTKDNFKTKKYEANKKSALHLDKKVQEKTGYSQKAKDLDAGNGFSGGAPASANTSVAYDNVGQSSVSSLQAFQGSRILNVKNKNVNTMGDEIVATEPETGKVLWNKKLSGNLENSGGSLGTSPAYAGGYVFVNSLQGKILQIDPSTGKTAQEYDTKETLRFQPIIHKGMIFTTSENGKIIAIKTGNEKLTGWTTWGGNSERTNKVTE